MPKWFGYNGTVSAFILSVFTVATLLIIAALIINSIFQLLANLLRLFAKHLSFDAAIKSVSHLESSSARVESGLRWLGTRAMRTSRVPTDRRMHLPSSSKHPFVRVARWALRRAWLTVRGVTQIFLALPGLVWTWFGGAVLLLSALMVFPDTVRRVAITTQDGLTAASISEVTLATIIAAAIPLTLVILRLLVGERTAARRTFRRERDVEALHKLYQAAASVANLSYALETQMYEMVQRFKVEKNHALRWRDWANRTTPIISGRHHDPDTHIECRRGCLEDRATSAPTRTPAKNVKLVINEVTESWSSLSGYESSFARLLPQRAWVGFISLRSCFSASGDFELYKVPTHDEWRRRRLAWQHDHLTWAEVEARDRAAGRNVAVRPTQSPNEAWLEHDLLDLVWDLAELSREFRDLADAANALARPRRFEKLMRASEG